MPDHHDFDVVLAEALFSAYHEEGPDPWKTEDGLSVPSWGELSQRVRNKWTAVAVEAQAILSSQKRAEGRTSGDVL
jgi:hypothetical protein